MGVFDAPRAVIEAVTGSAPVELFHNRQKAECCGAGSIMFMTDPRIAVQVAGRRLERAFEENIKTMITACQNCKGVFLNALKTRGDKLRVLDIAELVASQVE